MYISPRDQELRLECLRPTVSRFDEPDPVALAECFYAFVTAEAHGQRIVQGLERVRVT